MGLEPTTPALQERCSDQLSYSGAALIVSPGLFAITTTWSISRISAAVIRFAPPTTKSDASLLKDFARLLVRDDLALHPLEGVVDRLRVAAEPVSHVLVGRAFEVEAERVGLE